MTTRLHGAAEQARQIAGQPPTRRDPAQDPARAPEHATVTWARAQLREQIQQAGAALTATPSTADRSTPEADPSPLADREPEP